MINDKVFDWKGNELKAGDEVCFIKIRTHDWIQRMGILMPNTGETIWSDFKPEPEKDCWEIGDYVKIYEHNGGLYYTVNFGDDVHWCHISMLAVLPNPRTILAIKGVSDMPDK